MSMLAQSSIARGMSLLNQPDRGWKLIQLDSRQIRLGLPGYDSVPYWAALLSQAHHINCPADQIEYIEQQLAEAVARRMG
jgi:hypothetical protein